MSGLAYLPRNVEKSLVRFKLLRGTGTLSNQSEFMILRDSLIRGDYYVILLEFAW